MLARSPLRAGARATAEQVLAAVLDQTLRLLHPFVPFLTETLWEKLCELAPQRGIGAPLPPSEQLVHAAWPSGDAAWRAPAVERDIAAMQRWCEAIRETRARYQVAPKERLAARFAATGDDAATLRATAPLLAHMSGLHDVAIAADAQRTADSATVVLGASKAYLPGVVDLQKERAKLQKETEKLRGQIGGIERKLGNEGFVSKAPPAVIDKERGNLAALQAQLAGVEQSLRELAQ
jgi:valyl-tRNA synthetase